MRTKNSIKNIFWACIVFGINIIFNFFSKKLFIQFLGPEYNGLNSLFSSIISMLSIVEMGIGTTIIYKLYEPVSKEQKEEIKSLMGFYKKSYNILAVIILIIGLILIPFLPSIIGKINIDVNIYIAYILFLLNSVFSYLLSYKRSILIVNQKGRIIKKINLIYIVISNLLQITFLYYTKNYYLYLIIRMTCTVLENICITIKANKLYPYILEKNKPLDKKTRLDLIKRIKAMFFHQIGGFIVNGTDNILLSVMFGVTLVGYYNNYFFIISTLISFIDSIFSAIVASVGNLLADSNKEKTSDVYHNINFINFLIASYTACIFFMLIQPFIKFWLGESNLLGFDLSIWLTIYYYLRIMKFTAASFKNAAGIFYEDRFIPLIESIVNLISSIVFAKLFGISGIIMGTITSTLILYTFSYPKYVYKGLLGKRIKDFYLYNLKYLLFTFILIVFSYFINNIFIFENFLLELLKVTIIVSIIYISMIFIVYRNDSKLAYVKELVKKILYKKS